VHVVGIEESCLKILHQRTRVKRRWSGVGGVATADLISGGAGPSTNADLPPLERLQPAYELLLEGL
jgi:hypothetical protein